MKDTKRALRRHHLERMKAKAIRVYYFHSPEVAITYANHLKLCSRYCCGNRRPYEGRPRREKAWYKESLFPDE
jgi:hypothetical protein